MGVVLGPDSTHEGFDVLQLIRHSNLFKNATHLMLSTLLLADVAAKANTTVKDRNPSSTAWSVTVNNGTWSPTGKN
jgi:hypothetical protein